MHRRPEISDPLGSKPLLWGAPICVLPNAGWQKPALNKNAYPYAMPSPVGQKCPSFLSSPAFSLGENINHESSKNP
ncbi:uncharacterized protein VTP21DRAFT_1564 [Calcarisporiella thermophila]|uniref:uncharacterized protein n=1 Tax=Calcarisporiella thermophila TaxID=911321 RepID=UPI003743DF23